MASEHYDYSGDSDEGGYSDGSEDVYSEGDSYSDGEGEGEDSTQNYTVLGERDIWKRQEDDITKICNLLFVSRVSAGVLLCHYNWSVDGVQDTWFADEEKVRRTVGLLEKPVVEYADDVVLLCRICFESFSRVQMCSSKCGHQFCRECWTSYISISISDGPGCLKLRCPDPKCVCVVDQDLVNSLVSNEIKEKYSRYLLRSYVEASRKTKWCPAPDCGNAVDFVLGSGSYDVTCNCGCTFCWNCKEDAHRPVDCGTVSKWVIKNSTESENTNWILVNTKPCPKCKRSIEKNQGCMHMQCSDPCRFEFCWLCRGSWEEHGEGTGGFFTCNSYQQAKEEGTYDKEEKIREMAKNSLERYTHYYERWKGNQTSREKAMSDLYQIQTVHIKELSSIQAMTEGQLNFITEAWLQIIECRRVLKWTYAYGYYLPQHEVVKKELFEHLQGAAEVCLERLHQCTEKDLQEHLTAKGPSQNFYEFYTKLVDLTKVTRSYFENLVQALENDLPGVDSGDACIRTGCDIQLPTDETEGSRSGDAASEQSISGDETERSRSGDAASEQSVSGDENEEMPTVEVANEGRPSSSNDVLLPTDETEERPSGGHEIMLHTDDTEEKAIGEAMTEEERPSGEAVTELRPSGGNGFLLGDAK